MSQPQRPSGPAAPDTAPAPVATDEPGSPTPPGMLDEAGQQELIQQIGRIVMQSLPPGWQEAAVEYRATGSHFELAAELSAPNGTRIPLTPPTDVTDLFDQLRHGMHQQDRGTWISAVYRLQRPTSYSVDFNGDFEPAWTASPTAGDFAEELRRYPRAAVNIPEWLAEHTGPAVPETAGSRHDDPVADAGTGELRRAEVFDGSDESGRPLTDRPALSPEEHDRVLEYLERAPVVLAARSYDSDQLDPAGTPAVPLTFHTDGSWIWPGAVGYYLRTHGVPPQTELLSHIRQQNFRVPEVETEVRELAVSAVTAEQGM